MHRDSGNLSKYLTNFSHLFYCQNLMNTQNSLRQNEMGGGVTITLDERQHY